MRKLKGWIGKVTIGHEPKGQSNLFQPWFSLTALVPLVLASPSQAFGYVDPGTGSFAFQAAYAALVGGAFFLRKLLKRFGRK